MTTTLQPVDGSSQRWTTLRKIFLRFAFCFLVLRKTLISVRIYKRKTKLYYD